MTQEQGIARNIHTVEWLKAELAASTGSVYRALLQGNTETVADCLAGVVISSYLLGARLGLDHVNLDNAIRAKLELNLRQGHEMETWFGDLTRLRQHFQGDRR